MKILVPYVALLLLAFVVVGIFISRTTRDFLIGQRMRDERQRTEKLATDLAPLVDAGRADELYAVARAQKEATPSTRLLILSPKGTVLVESSSELNGARIDLPEVERVLLGDTEAAALYTISSTTSQRTTVPLFSFLRDNLNPTEVFGYYTSVVISKGQRVGIILRSASIQDVEDQILNITSTMIIAFAGATGAILLLGFFVSGLIVRPVNALSVAMKKASSGDFTVRAPTRGHDEIARLASTFNMMSEKLENLDRTRNTFISSASHELKTPLASMKILVESLLSQPCDPEITQDFLTDVNHEIDRLSAIINDLLTLVQFDAGEVVPKSERINLDDMLLESIRRLRPIARSREIEISLDVDAAPVYTIGDSIRINQVFYNLVDNAVKYTQDGGKVHVELSAEADQAVVRVSDNGVGIPQADIGHIFERFYRVDKARSRNTGGTGLGLSIVSDTIKRHGGEITVESQEKVGTTFTVRLPRARQGDAI